MVRVTRSAESERIRGEREMEESKAEREEGKAAGDVRNVTTQVGSLLSICEAFFFFVPCVPFNASSSISFSQEVQTVGARFTKHKPELLELVVWSQQLWVLRFTNGTRDWAQVNNKVALGSIEGFYKPLPEGKDPGQLPHLLPWVGGTEKIFHPPVL